MSILPQRWKDEIPELPDAEDWPLLAALVLLPWAFGGVETWAYRGASFLLALSAGIVISRRGYGALALRGKLWLLPALLLGLFAAAQLVPLPPAAISLLSPRADAIYRETFPAYPDGSSSATLEQIEARALAGVPEAATVPLPDRGERLLGPGIAGRWTGWRPLSLLPRAGMERLHWYVALLLAFVLVAARARDPERMHLYRGVFFLNFVLLAVVGLLHAATASETLLWGRTVRPDAHPFGPYVNPDHFAGLMELGVLWLAGYALAAARREGGGLLGLVRTPIFAAGAMVTAAAALAAASKASAVLLAGGLTVLVLVAARRARMRLAVLGGAAVIWTGAALLLRDSRLAERIAGFLDTTTDLEAIDRVIVSRAAVPMFLDFPIVGSGFGSFREVFPGYLPTGEYLVWEYLHNDWFQVLTGGGIVAGVLLLWLVTGYWFRVLRPSAWRGHRGPDLETIGLALGLITLSVHAAVDFNHQIPANALTFVALAAVLLIRADATRAGEEEGAG